MTTINRSFKTPKGTNVTVDLTIENFGVNGTAAINGASYGVTGHATVQGKKVLKMVGMSAPYLPIPDSLYAELDKACKVQFSARLTPLEIAEGKVREAEAKYKKLSNQGWNNAAIIQARSEWDSLSAEYHKLLNSK